MASNPKRSPLPSGSSSSNYNRFAAELDGILKQWRERLLGCTRYLILDTRYEKVRRNGAVLSCAVLIERTLQGFRWIRPWLPFQARRSSITTGRSISLLESSD